MNSTKSKITRRGWRVIATLAITAGFAIGYGTAGYCWNGHGYSSCIDAVHP